MRLPGRSQRARTLRRHRHRDRSPQTAAATGSSMTATSRTPNVSSKPGAHWPEAKASDFEKSANATTATAARVSSSSPCAVHPYSRSGTKRPRGCNMLLRVRRQDHRAAARGLRGAAGRCCRLRPRPAGGGGEWPRNRGRPHPVTRRLIKTRARSASTRFTRPKDRFVDRSGCRCRRPPPSTGRSCRSSPRTASTGVPGGLYGGDARRSNEARRRANRALEKAGLRPSPWV